MTVTTNGKHVFNCALLIIADAYLTSTLIFFPVIEELSEVESWMPRNKCRFTTIFYSWSFASWLSRSPKVKRPTRKQSPNIQNWWVIKLFGTVSDLILTLKFLGFVCLLCFVVCFILWFVYFLIITISAANQKYFMGTTNCRVDETRSYQNILTRQVIYLCSLLEMHLH